MTAVPELIRNPDHYLFMMPAGNGRVITIRARLRGMTEPAPGRPSAPQWAWTITDETGELSGDDLAGWCDDRQPPGIIRELAAWLAACAVDPAIPALASERAFGRRHRVTLLTYACPDARP